MKEALSIETERMDDIPSPLQQQILALFGFSPAVYLGLADDS